MEIRSGYLTIYSPDRSEIYGEFVDGQWQTETTGGGENHVLSGTGSEGTMDTFRRLNIEGVSNVAYEFDSNGYRYGGTAQLLSPDEKYGQTLVRIETGDKPERT